MSPRLQYDILYMTIDISIKSVVRKCYEFYQNMNNLIMKRQIRRSLNYFSKLQ